MTRAASIAALVVIVLGVVAILLAPTASRTPTRARPADLWGGARGVAATGPAAGAAAPGAPPAVPPLRHILEQVSPIVGSESTLTEALGFEMHEKFTTVLPIGAPVPVRRVVTFRTSGDDQKEIRLHVLRGKSDAAAADTSLGWVRISDLPPGPRGSTKVAVLFEVVDGAIALTAADPETGRLFSIAPSEAPPGSLP